MIRRRTALLLGTLMLAILSAVLATGASAFTLELRETARFPGQKFLMDSRGYTLYLFEKDSKNVDNCIAIPNCAHVWPPLLVPEEGITLGPGIRPNKVGAITLPGGEKQITYNHKPLYGYIGDHEPAQSSYIGAVAFGGYWFALNRNGHGR